MGKTAFFMVFAAFALSGCGGGGVSAAPTITPPPITPPLVPATCPESHPENDNGVCRPAPLNSRHNTQEYLGIWALNAVRAISAYDAGYHGQGVTVGIHEGPSNGRSRTTHDDLRQHMSLPSREDRGAGVSNHITSVAQIIGGARNDNVSHGVAPSVQLVWEPGITPPQPSSLFFAAPIKNYSVGLGFSYDTLQEAVDAERNSRDPNDVEFKRVLLHNDSVAVVGASNDGENTAPFRYRFNTDAPRIAEELEPHFIAVAALAIPNVTYDQFGMVEFLNIRYDYADLTLAPYSNACGHGKMWCVAAPAEGFRVPSTTSDNGFRWGIGGTSSAAPVVAGVLAVMKSAAPNIPMTMHRIIMFDTATPLGSRITTGLPDDLYGWGLPNLSAAIVSITSMKTANLACMSAVPLRSLRHEFPAEFSRLRGQLSDLTVAIEITDGAYYNMPLADIIPPQTNNINFGNAAEELLADNAQNQQNGVNAFGDSDNGFGLRWHNNFQSGGMHAELSYLPKTSGIVGAETAAKIGLRRPLFGGFMFGEYGGGFAKTQTSGGYVAAAEDISTEEWTMGAEVLDLLRAGDKFRFSVRSGKRIRGGKVRVSLPVATGDFYQSFLGEKMQDLHISHQDISLSEDAPLIYSAGYSVRGKKTEWAMAAELSETGDGKLSAKYRVEF